MSFAVTAAVVGGVASVGAGVIGLGASAIGAAGAGALGLAGAGASAIGGLASGAGSLLFGAPAAGVTVGQQMASIAQPAYYEAAGGGILGGVASAASSTIGYLGEMVPAATGLFQLIKPPEQGVAPQAPGAVPSVTAPSATTPGIAKSPLPIFGQQPAVMTVGTAPPPKEANLMLYIGLAALAFLLLRKK